MRKIKEILRLRWELGRGVREIARSVLVSHSTVSDLLGRVQAAGLGWPLPDELDEQALEAVLYPGNHAKGRQRPEPDWHKIHLELRRKGVTLQLLWLEYKQDHPDGYQYSQFCELYRRFRRSVDVVMRQPHRAGERVFVDYAGQTVPVVDPKTGEVRYAHIFVGVLPASNYTYSEAQWSEDLENWIYGHIRLFEFLGGVPEIVQPDNTKTGVKNPSYYEPDLNPTYQEMAAHYGAVVIPTRPRRPGDKAKVETAVQLVERWILAALRHQTFFSLDELNQAIRERLAWLNRRPFRKLEGCRQSVFESLEKPVLKPLPARRYEFARWKKARVHIDHHVEVEHNYYSVPYELVGREVDVRVTLGTVEILHRGRRVASHVRATGKGHFVTDPQHRPPAHRAYLEWTPERIIRWGESVGPHTAELVRAIFASRPHPEQGYRATLGIMRLAKYYPHERMEAAAARALAFRVYSFRSLKSILERGLDRLPVQTPLDTRPVTHANVRGAAYYGEKGRSGTC